MINYAYIIFVLCNSPAISGYMFIGCVSYFVQKNRQNGWLGVVHCDPLWMRQAVSYIGNGTGSTKSTLLHDKFNPKNCQVLSLNKTTKNLAILGNSEISMTTWTPPFVFSHEFTLGVP